MEFLLQGFRHLQPEQDRRTETDATECIIILNLLLTGRLSVCVEKQKVQTIGNWFQWNPLGLVFLLTDERVKPTLYKSHAMQC